MVRPGWLTRWLGDKGERLAVRHLKRQGYRILARQSRNRIGELDVVALDGECIVFVEVKPALRRQPGIRPKLSRSRSNGN